MTMDGRPTFHGLVSDLAATIQKIHDMPITEVVDSLLTTPAESLSPGGSESRNGLNSVAQHAAESIIQRATSSAISNLKSTLKTLESQAKEIAAERALRSGAEINAWLISPRLELRLNFLESHDQLSATTVVEQLTALELGHIAAIHSVTRQIKRMEAEMAQKPETRFRVNTVKPFLRTLKNSYTLPIQQVAICGDPDFVLVMNGVFVGLELKDEGEEPRPLQELKGKKIERAGGVYLVATPANWEEIKQELTRLDKGERKWK